MRPRALVPLSVLLLVAATCAPALSRSVVSPGAAELDAHVAALTGPEMEGRGSGTPGGDRAARYIAGALAAAGLRPAGDGGTYFQSFVVAPGARPGPGTALELIAPSGRTFEQGRDWMPHRGSLQGEVTGEVVPAGYGTTAPDGSHDDYAGVDVRGKIALALDGAPPFGGQRASRLEKLITARRNGARALLIAGDALPTPEATAATFALPAASITRAAAAALAPGAQVRLRVVLEREDRRAANVVAVLPGADPALASEAVVLGAHYDHLGRVAGVVHPGADDNASGTAVVLGLARALAAAGGLSRTVVFVLFADEELGLLGSDHYVRHPAVPIGQAMAMLNFDMVGRMRDNRLSVDGVESAAGLRALVSEAAKDGGLDLSLSDSPFAPSDHTRFYSAGIPVLFFFTGRHADYHQPTDSADKINAAGMARVAALAARLVERLAVGARPAYAQLSRPARSPRASEASGGGFLGIAADLRAESDGVRLGSIVPGSPAARAGMRGGYVLVRVGDATVNTFEDLRRLLRRQRPGDTVRVVYLRDGQDHETSATLGARP